MKGQESGKILSFFYSIGKFPNKGIGQDLHIARQYNEIDLQRLEQGNLSDFLLCLIGFGDGHVFEANIKTLGQSGQTLVVTDDDRDVDVPFP